MQEVDIPTLADRLSDQPSGRRLIAIAGAPGSGKSTLAADLAARLGPRAMVVPMDGFHYDDAVLEARGHRPRKGAPHTFDVDGLRVLLQRLRAGDAPVAIPLFDRSIEVARAGAAIVPQEAELLLVEGNYLLLDQAPWDSLAPLFDQTVMLEVPEAVLRDRLGRRWVELGLDEAAVTAKLEENDLPNGRTIRDHSRRPDLLVRHG